VIQPKPASYSAAFHSCAAATSAASCSGVFSSSTPTRSLPSPQTNFSSARGSALSSRNARAARENASRDTSVVIAAS
jgi:hypothetical protein